MNVGPFSVLAAFSLEADRPAAEGSPDRVCGDLAALEEKVLPTRVRRIGRQVKLALLGAAACLKDCPRPVPGDLLGVFLGTGLGNTGETTPVVEQAVAVARGASQAPPSPVQFANSVSNSATFFVARAAGATGANLVVTAEELSFEAALFAAGVAMRAGDVGYALVGGVDEYLEPRDALLTRVSMPAGTVLGEGSGWLLIGPAFEGGKARIEAMEPALADRGGGDPSWIPAVAGEVARVRAEGEPVTVLRGPRIDGPALAVLLDLVPGASVDEYLARTGWFHAAAACALARAVSAGTRGLYAHVGRNVAGDAAFVILRVG